MFKQLGKRRLKRGQKLDVPTKMAKAPTVMWGLELYWRAFWDLEPDRHDAARPITWSQIMDWAERKGLDEFQKDSLVHHVRAMDKVLLAWKAKKTKSGKTKGKPEKDDDAQRVRPKDARYGRSRRTQRAPAEEGTGDGD